MTTKQISACSSERFQQTGTRLTFHHNNNHHYTCRTEDIHVFLPVFLCKSHDKAYLAALFWQGYYKSHMTQQTNGDKWRFGTNEMFFNRQLDFSNRFLITHATHRFCLMSKRMQNFRQNRSAFVRG